MVPHFSIFIIYAIIAWILLPFLLLLGTVNFCWLLKIYLLFIIIMYGQVTKRERERIEFEFELSGGPGPGGTCACSLYL